MPGKELDEVENAGTRAVAIPPRPELCDPASHGRSRLAAALFAAITVPALSRGTVLAFSSPVLRATDPDEVDALHQLILASLDDDQAVDTISIPLAGKSS